MKTAAWNFGVMHNGMVCDCGKHIGVGDLHAGDRAARYARMRDTIPCCLTDDNRKYLESWERTHGKVVYEMRGNIARIINWQPAGSQPEPALFDCWYEKD